jgi:hypothetical protein
MPEKVARSGPALNLYLRRFIGYGSGSADLIDSLRALKKCG